jgi:class 3 adenylate cyclase
MSALLRVLKPLAFDEPELETRFAEHYVDRFVPQLRFALLVGLAFMLGDAAIDFAFDRVPAFRANMLRLFAVVPIIGASFALTFWNPFRRYLERYCAVVGLALALMLFGAMRLLEIDGGMGLSSWVAPLNYTFVMIFVFVIVGIRLVYALWVALLATAGFLAIVELTLNQPVERSFQGAYHIVTVLLLCAFLGYWRELYLRRAFRAGIELEAERGKTDAILFELIPPRIVDRLKTHGPPIVESFAEATVVFADIVGFTKLTTRIGPEHLLEIIDRIFAGFDRITATHETEKVKTIGDSYMAIAHTGQGHVNTAERAIRCGRDWLELVRGIGEEIGQPVELRIGIHTGPVIGGVVGSRSWSYDYWGDTVNIASRIEKACTPGTVLVSEATYWRARDGFAFDAVGPVDLKGRGAMECFALAGPATPAGADRPQDPATARRQG